MPAISLPALLATKLFRGGRGLTVEGGAESLAAALNTVISSVRTVITRYNAGTLDALVVDPSGAVGTYGVGNESWLVVDGTNPPTLSSFRIIDRNGGAYVTATYDSAISAIDLQFA